MIKLENTKIVGLEPAIRGMRNPMNSWDRSDSGEYCDERQCLDCPGYSSGKCNVDYISDDYIVGPNDLDLMKRLASSGPVHAKYRRMIVVYVDTTAPLYWWKEFDTYKVGTVANSCSTMHKIHAKEFELDDFSHEHLFKQNDELATPEYYERRSPVFSPYSTMEILINALNNCREKFIETGDKVWWWQMIQLLPTSYNQKRTIMLNYEVLANIYKWRKDHKLDEWHKFCDWIESLPYAKEVILCQDLT